MRRAPIALALLASLAPACEREQRRFRPPPETEAGAPQYVHYAGNAYALGQGKQLFVAFNCNGCHANGGGGMGPALMDERWIYGSRPEEIYASIARGRPNGMPPFQGRIPPDQIWQLTAYVHALGGRVPSDAAPGRNDHMQITEPESQREALQPVQVPGGAP
jgi:cytochrome c oxidase cbb3-type subunit III